MGVLIVPPGAARRCWRCSAFIASGRYCQDKGCRPSRSHSGPSRTADLRAEIDRSLQRLRREGKISVGTWRPDK